MITYNGSILKVGGSTLDYGSVPPYPPLPDIPDGGLVGIWKQGTEPAPTKGTKLRLYQEPNIWLVLNPYDWQSILSMDTNLTEIIGANSTGVVACHSMFEGCSSLTKTVLFDISHCNYDLSYMFANCESLTEVPLFNLHGTYLMKDTFYACFALEHVPLFDTSTVGRMHRTFMLCMALKEIPAFDMSNIINLVDAFCGCNNVESGMVSLYNAAVPHSQYFDGCFTGCGTDTASGMAERAQIPTSWGGDMA
jgi:hypothetical protein